MDNDDLESLDAPVRHSVVSIMKKYQRIVKLFNQSTRLMNKLRNEFTKNNLPFTGKIY